MNLAEKRKIVEAMIESVVWKIDKFDSKTGKKIGHEEFLGNCLANEGIEEWFKLIATTGAVQYDNTNAFLIVGTGSGAATASDNQGTFTAGVTKLMEATYPQVAAAASHKCTWKASYGSGDANQVWGEFGLLNHATTGKLANRKVSAQGTKTSGLMKSLARVKSLLINGEHLRQNAMATLSKQIRQLIGQLQRLSEETAIMAEATVRTYAKA